MPALRLLIATLAGLTPLLAHAAAFPVLRDQPVAARTNLVAAQSYVYGFPLLLMDETRNKATEAPYFCGLGGPVNHFTHKFDVPTPEFHAVVRPNVDTLYSSAFLDLSRGPLVLDLPAVRDRFYLMAMLDAWTNNFAGPGTQTNGGAPSTYLITGPGWNGALPAGMQRIAAPTDLVWIIGRTELKGPADREAVNAVQESYKLYPLGGTAPERSDTPCQSTKGQTQPEDTIKALSGFAFFERLNTLMAAYPPPADDRRMLRKLGAIGVGQEAETALADLRDRNLEALDAGVERGQNAIDSAIELSGNAAWTPDPSKISLGEYDHKMLVRAVVAQIGFGANRNEFATYQNARQDADGHKLDGSKGVYELRFKAGDTPPVGGFWSVTVYDSDGFLVANPINRYALGSNSALAASDDGDVAITFATTRPDDTPDSNWLPVPSGPFEVTLRMYAPDDAIQTGKWSAPPIEKR